jgi:hypothetical protein
MRTSMRTGLQVALVVGGGIFFSAQASADDTTTGRDSLLGGTQVVTSIEVPVTVSGNSVSVVGDSRSSRHHHDKAAVRPSRDGTTRAGTTSTSGADSVAGGTQVVAPVSVPVTVGGNAVSVIGDSRSSDGGTGVASGGSDSAGIGSTSTSGEDSLAGGTQVVAPVSVPVTVGGNAVSVIGDSSTDPVQPTNPVAPTEPTDPTGPTTPADPTDPEGAGTVVDPASWVSFGTASQKVATLVVASPAATTLAQTGAPSALLVGVGLLLLLAGGLLTRTGRRVAATG